MEHPEVKNMTFWTAPSCATYSRKIIQSPRKMLNAFFFVRYLFEEENLFSLRGQSLYVA